MLYKVKFIYTISCITTIIFIICKIIIHPVYANDLPVSHPEAINKQVNQQLEFTVFPVSLNTGKSNDNSIILVRGKENGSQAIDLPNWLLPYDIVIKTLKFNQSAAADGQLELRSPGIVTRIDPNKLQTDPELGLVFSIADLQTLFGIKAKFDINEYAIVLDIPWFSQTKKSNNTSETPIILDGLPIIKPDNFNIAAIEEKVNVTTTANTSRKYQGNFLAVGTLAGGSWYLTANQPDLENSQTWRINEAQFFHQNNKADYFIGSHPVFWPSQNLGDYWGFTLINRQGFTPLKSFGGSFSDPRQRLQTRQTKRTITGKAEPGTLVRLVQGFGDKIIAETLVDSSGIYRFENIKGENQSLTSNYRILLYPQGRLTAQPEIQEANFSVIPGQIPDGTSAWVISGGWRRRFAQNQNFIGNFSDFQGGIAERWGLSEELTIGLGAVYDKSIQGLAEIFYRPANFPLQVAISALAGNEWNTIADIHYQPLPQLNLTFTKDFISSGLNINWNLFPGIGLFANTTSRDATSGGIQLSFNTKNFSSFSRVSLDTENHLRWNSLQRLGKLELNLQGSEIGSLSKLAYNFSAINSFGHSLLLSYETRNLNSSNNLLTLAWQYRSQKKTIDNAYLWAVQIGYGIGSQGNGIIVSLETTAIPGLLLRGRYEDVSLTANEPAFKVELVSSLNLQKGISLGDRRSNYFRTQGGLLIQPFFDQNNNGQIDIGEKLYTENLGTIVSIDNKPLKFLQPNIQSDRATVRLATGTYRLDIDPADFPLDWQTKTTAYAVNVVAGSYTPVLIPLIRSYTVSGIVTNTQGKAVTGAKVEAVSTIDKSKKFSITNDAGVYYLEGLSIGSYTLEINGKFAGKLTLDVNSQSLTELNLQQ